MNEKLVIIPKLVTSGKKMMTIVLFVIACILLLLSTFVSPLLFFLPAILVMVLWVWQGFFSNVEFEYTYFDGDLRFAKIKNKAKRKKIADINMEDVVILAPKGDRGVYKYENDKNLKCINLTSGRADAKVYELIVKNEEGFMRIEFEPDEEILNAMMVKYARIIVK